MNNSGTGMGWGARLVVALVLILIGAAAAIWALGHYQPAARFLGITATQPQTAMQPASPPSQTKIAAPPVPMEAPVRDQDARISALESRLGQVENATERAEGSAGRADALVVAFAARRAIDRGVALGYLENLLAERFGAQHPAAVATIVTASHQPVKLNDLVSEYEGLGTELRRGGAQDSWWTNLKHEFGSLVEVHRADRPSINAEARYNRAMQRLSSGDVDQALAETMRLPGAGRAGDWTTKARRYVAAHRALDEIESAALLPGANAAR